jgi:peptide/nickel transport system substrate-binding protein
MHTRPVITATVGAALVVALAACTGGGQTPDFDANDVIILTPAATGEVDAVRWGIAGSEPTTLDPIYVGSAPQNIIVANLCEGLLQLQPDYSSKPGLAESWEQPDATTTVFTIREGVTFWNGDPLTADDVAFSLNRNMDPATGAYNGFLYARVASIEATGPLEVTVTFNQPDANFFAVASGLSGAISQRAAVEAAGVDYGTPVGGLMCTGPYELGDWKSGEGIDITANPDYWNEELAPLTQSVHFDAIADDNTLTTALRSGDLDGAYGVPTAAISTLRASTGTLYFGESTQYFLFGPVNPDGPASDVRVRQAMDLAMDREAFVTNVLKGAGEPLYTFIPPFAVSGHPASDILLDASAQLEGQPHADLEAAKALIEEANLTDTTMTLAITAGDQESLAAATLMQAAVKDIGLEITIVQLQDTEIFDLFFNPAARADVDLLASSGYFESSTFLSYTSAFVYPDGLVNFLGWDSPEAVGYIDQAITATDPVESAEAYVAGQKIWHDARLVVPLSVQYELLYLREGLTGPPASSAYVSYPWAALLGSE